MASVLQRQDTGESLRKIAAIESGSRHLLLRERDHPVGKVLPVYAAAAVIEHRGQHTRAEADIEHISCPTREHAAADLVQNLVVSGERIAAVRIGAGGAAVIPVRPFIEAFFVQYKSIGSPF